MTSNTLSNDDVTERLSREKISTVIKETSRAKEVENLQAWYSEYIDLFREQYEKLTEEEKKCVSNSKNFTKPCQIEVFWIKDPSCQLIVQSNFTDRPDKEIIINGPYSTHEFLEKVGVVLLESRWQKKIEQGTSVSSNHSEETYAYLIANRINWLIENFKNRLFHRAVPGVYSMGITLRTGMWLQEFRGNIANMEKKHDIDQIIQAIKSEAVRRKEPAQNTAVTLTEEKFNGIGIHLFPPVIVGKRSKPTLEQLLNGNTLDFTLNDKVLDTEINGNVVILNKDGYLFIETNQKNDGLRVLNLIMALGYFHDLPLFSVKEHEISQASVNEKTKTLTSYTWSHSSIRSYLFDEGFGKQSFERYPKKEVEEQKMMKILDDAKTVIKFEKLSEELRLFNEAHTHLTNSEYAQSFVMSWSVIERHYSDVWRKKLDTKDVDEERLSKLTNSAQWSIDFVLEVLNLGEELEDNSYDLLMELKKKRNQFYHRGKQVTKEDAERCLKFARSILDSKIAAVKKGSTD